MFKSVGKLIYSPKSHLGDASKWLVLMCDDEISKYYRHLYQKQYPYLNSGLSKNLTRPVFGSHISVIRGERIINHNLWGLDKNKLIEFEYEPGVKSNNEYYWLTVSCPYLNDLREKYELSREPKYGLHLTVGRSTL